MYYKQILASERHTIDKLGNIQKLSITQIAKILNRNKSTISREINRNSIDGKYIFEVAHNKSEERSKHKYFFRQLNYLEFNKLFLSKYDKRVHGVKATGFGIQKHYQTIRIPSLRQIFNGIKSNRGIIKWRDRLRQYYRKGRKRKIGMFSKFKGKYVFPIGMRPKSIDLRGEYGHGEVDLVIGKKAKGFANLLTFTERKSRLHLFTKVYSKNPMKINSAIYELIKKHNLNVKTITVDNGIEFEKIGLLGYGAKCKIYFCEPYASYQRGSNEHANGLIRRFWKKGTDFTPIPDEDIDAAVDMINCMPREMFGWKSAIEVYQEQYK